MSEFLVYLAGPITGDTWDGAKDWREYAAGFLNPMGIRTLDPLRGKDFLEEYIRNTGLFDKSYTDIHPLSSKHGITKRDQWDVSRCDLVLVNFTDTPYETFYPKDGVDMLPYSPHPEYPLAIVKREIVSIGTVMEIAWAHLYGKYVLVAMEEDNIHNHGMLTEAASVVVPTFKEALELVPVVLGVK